MRRIPPLALLAPLALAACRQDMAQQRKFEVYEPAPLWADRTSARPFPEGVVAEGEVERARAARQPPHVTPALLERGQERYRTFCTPCHGIAGEGDGMIVQRGFPRPPSYHSERLRAVPAQHFVDVISEGYGVMYPYASRVAPQDRWAIAAYIRVLQTSHAVALAAVPEAREHLP